MSRRTWSRRKFLGAGVVGAASIPLVNAVALSQGTGRQAFSSRHRALLSAAMDEIIPAGNGMPSAGEAGCLQYLERLALIEKDLQKKLRDALNRLHTMARATGRRDFPQLASERRVDVLKRLESGAFAADFHTLRDAVYEAYYLQPAVWKLLGFEFYPPERPGPLPAPFDDAVLERVKRMPKLYREVD